MTAAKMSNGTSHTALQPVQQLNGFNLLGSLNVGNRQWVLVYSSWYSRRALRLRSKALKGTCKVSL